MSDFASAGAAPGAAKRFVFVDALRGIASLWVLFYHLLAHSTHFGPPEPMDGLVRRGLPDWIETLSFYGSNGVPIFFVLSGFVIAYSLRNNPLNATSIREFILRRQFRLDPPYWAMVMLMLVILKLEQWMPGLRAVPAAAPTHFPSPPVILLNLFYLQNLAHVQMILGVAWTLCIEIQFYLVFIALLALAHRLSAGEENRSRFVATLLVLLTGLASLAFVLVSKKQALFIQYWHSFAAGVLCYWMLAGRASRRDLGIYLGGFALIIAAFALRGRHSASVNAISLGCAWLSTLALYGAGMRDGLTRWCNGPVLQYLGRISYSLYLVHVPVLTWTLPWATRGAAKTAHWRCCGGWRRAS